jgi:hypothetical protein
VQIRPETYHPLSQRNSGETKSTCTITALSDIWINFRVARNPSRVDVKRGDHFLQADIIVPNPRFADNRVDLRSVRHYGVSWMLSGFGLAQLPYVIGLRSHGVESYVCSDDKLSLTHER